MHYDEIDEVCIDEVDEVELVLNLIEVEVDYLELLDDFDELQNEMVFDEMLMVIIDEMEVR